MPGIPRVARGGYVSYIGLRPHATSDALHSAAHSYRAQRNAETLAVSCSSRKLNPLRPLIAAHLNVTLATGVQNISRASRPKNWTATID